MASKPGVPIEDLKFNNLLLFQVWCKHHVRCDQCQMYGAVPLRDHSFWCTDCCRLYGNT